MPADWNRIARRIRIPLGFAFAAVYLWLAQPTWRALAAGAAIAALGLWLRGFASGHVRKAAELTTTGPYAYTRNPLYLGTVIIAIGFGVAARNWWLALGMLAMFLAIYLPTIRFEERFLREQFGAAFDAYCARVPRLLPRLRAEEVGAGAFSRALYLKHREYQSALGAALMFTALAAKLWFSTAPVVR